MKDTDLDNKVYELEDSQHIYDDPNLLMDSCLKMPLPPTTASYDVLNRDASAASKLQPTTRTAVDRGEVVKFSMSDGRYTSVTMAPTSQSLDNKPVPPRVPPGYSSPKSLVPTRPPAPKAPPGYAVPRPHAPEKVDLAEDKEETVGYFPLMNGKVKESGTYQELVAPSPAQQVAMTNPAQKDATANPAHKDVTVNNPFEAVSPPSAIEEEEYVEMQSPQAETPFPE